MIGDFIIISLRNILGDYNETSSSNHRFQFTVIFRCGTEQLQQPDRHYSSRIGKVWDNRKFHSIAGDLPAGQGDRRHVAVGVIVLRLLMTETTQAGASCRHNPSRTQGECLSNYHVWHSCQRMLSGQYTDWSHLDFVQGQWHGGNFLGPCSRAGINLQPHIREWFVNAGVG